MVTLPMFYAQLTSALEGEPDFRAELYAVIQVEVSSDTWHIVIEPEGAAAFPGPWRSDPDVLVMVPERAAFEAMATSPELVPAIVAAGQATMGESADPSVWWGHWRRLLELRQAWAAKP